MSKKLEACVWAVCIGALVFAPMNIVFRADISVLAFPLSLVFALVLSLVCVKFLLKQARCVPAARKLLQYLPIVLLCAFALRRAGEYGTSFVFDAASVFLWLFSSAASLAALFFLHEKRIRASIPALAESRTAKPAKKNWGARRVLIEILEWLDALVQAVFAVALINIFIAQLYEIPSESMVPEFLVRDRVVVFKTPSGSRFPLAQVGIPRLRSYKRGDIIVFRNPHYSQDRKSEVKSFVSQLVFMITFTAVNLNVDDDGKPKADPLVKRITGEPGEQLMMQDGVLYARREGSGFVPVTREEEWAAWNVAGFSSKFKQNIRMIPIFEREYDAMIACEELRNSVTWAELRDECIELSGRFAAVRKQLGGPQSAGADWQTLISRADFDQHQLISQNESLARRLLTAAGGEEWFTHFMTGWISALDPALFDFDSPPSISRERFLAGGNLYDDANLRMNLLIKRAVGRLVTRNAELTATRVSSAQWSQDSERRAALAEAELLNLYVFLLDRRNMPLFPANGPAGEPRYIPKNEYFMMGDNRFNSLDMRHSYEDELRPLSGLDPMPVYYFSNMSPQSVNAQSILGSPVLRVWPLSRAGVPGITGKKKAL